MTPKRVTFRGITIGVARTNGEAAAVGNRAGASIDTRCPYRIALRIVEGPRSFDVKEFAL